ISKALKTFEERGPDDKQIIVEQKFVIGFNRLSINNLDNGKQPRLFKVKPNSPESFALFNGEIFNYKELESIHLNRPHDRDELGVIIDLYKKFNKDFISLLNGQYSIALFDSENEKILLSRDPFGIRPLFYIVDFSEGLLYFSSDLRGLFSLGIKKDPDYDQIARMHLTWSTSSPKTIWKNIYQIEPGYLKSIFLKKNNQFSEENTMFWDWPNKIASQNKNIKKLQPKDIDLFKEKLNGAIRRQTMSEVGYASYLSGGIDSSIIAYELSKISPNLETFSIAFSDAEYDESKNQNLLVNSLGLINHQLKINDEVISNLFPEAISKINQTIFRTAPIPLLRLSEKVRDSSFKVVLTGEGADEILFGYDIFREYQCIEFVNKRPSSKWRYHIFDNLYSYLPQFNNPRYRKIAIETLMREGDFSILNPLKSRLSNNLRTMLTFNDSEKIIEQTVRSLIEEYENEINRVEMDAIDVIQLFEIKNLLSGYLLSSQGDRMSMASSVEGRYPFLDLEFVNYAFSIPRKFKLDGNKFKHIAKLAYKDNLPEEIINAPKIAYQAPEGRAIISNQVIRSNLKNKNNIIYKHYSYEKINKIINRVNKHTTSKARGSFGDNMTLSIVGSLDRCLN
ncbi:asparagine synthase (glutamine-hydrolyzing), partial [Prochlorococcus sp. AH-716-B04]|nr:asparagine synthase (glutamine-hydrolyzing) [Prochlorococcus sp. AH-716-B04]